MAERRSPACIYVLAGTNGAGKSSIAGAAFNARGAEYFNPDQAAHQIIDAHSGLTQEQANSAAWHQGRRLLERAIAERLTFAFETTLGGSTITGLLEQALAEELEVRVWYAALSSPELHLARVRTRRSRGGHDIPEAEVRRRYDTSRLNLVRLLPKLTELRVYDNSVDADPHTGRSPQPLLVLHMLRGRIANPRDLTKTPEWAKPIVAAALQAARPRRRS